MNAQQITWITVWGLFTGFIGGAVSVWVFLSPPALAEKPPSHEKVLRAEKIALVDQGGHEHATLTIGSDGNPTLTFFDVNHLSRVVLELMADGNARLFLSDQEAKIRMVLGLATDGSPFLHLKNKDREIIWSAP